MYPRANLNNDSSLTSLLSRSGSSVMSCSYVGLHTQTLHVTEVKSWDETETLHTWNSQHHHVHPPSFWNSQEKRCSTFETETFHFSNSREQDIQPLTARHSTVSNAQDQKENKIFNSQDRKKPQHYVQPSRRRWDWEIPFVKLSKWSHSTFKAATHSIALNYETKPILRHSSFYHFQVPCG